MVNVIKNAFILADLTKASEILMRRIVKLIGYCRLFSAIGAARCFPGGRSSLWRHSLAFARRLLLRRFLK